MADAKSVLEFAKENGAKLLDLRFTDLPGLWHHVSYPIAQFSEASFEEGFGMDGSSIRGWAAIHESDMLLIPDADMYMLDPFTEVPTLVMIVRRASIPVTKQRYDRDPRYIAKKAEMYLMSTGLADTAYFGAEAEFFIFDNVRFDQREHARLLLHRRRRGPLELRPRGEQPGLPSALQGRLLPGSAHRPLPGPAHRDGDDHAELRAGGGVPPPRSGHRRTDRDRSEVRLADASRPTT